MSEQGELLLKMEQMICFSVFCDSQFLNVGVPFGSVSMSMIQLLGSDGYFLLCDAEVLWPERVNPRRLHKGIFMMGVHQLPSGTEQPRSGETRKEEDTSVFSTFQQTAFLSLHFILSVASSLGLLPWLS